MQNTASTQDDYATRHGYPTTPVETKGMPPGIPYIIGNEFAERFCFYGMRGILIVFMTKFLLDASGKPANMTEDEAKTWYHLFVAGVYAFPFLGAILADGFLGKYRTIFYLSIVYCLGSLALAFDSTRLGLFLGLAMIVIGAGGIKPCVSATVGDQFGKLNEHLLPKVFSWFYFSINCGSFVAMMITPAILDHYTKNPNPDIAKWGPHIAFGIPGVLMLIATVIFWMGRGKYVHAAPAGKEFLTETFNIKNLKMLGGLIVLYVFVAVFWSLYDQTSSAWVLQAEKMDLNMFGYNLSAAQVQSVNPLLILLFIPIFSYAIYPLAGKFIECTPLRKISAGLFLAVIAFGISAYVEKNIADKPTIWWQVLGYAFMTGAEILISITCLEYSYTQAPARLKSLVMSIYLGSIACGNLFTSLVNHFIQNPDHTSKLPGASYYYFFTGLMLATAVLFLILMPFMGKKKTDAASTGPQVQAQ